HRVLRRTAEDVGERVDLHFSDRLAGLVDDDARDRTGDRDQQIEAGLLALRGEVDERDLARADLALRADLQLGAGEAAQLERAGVVGRGLARVDDVHLLAITGDAHGRRRDRSPVRIEDAAGERPAGLHHDLETRDRLVVDRDRGRAGRGVLAIA